MIGGCFAMDYQVHSFRSHDGLATIYDQCVRAVEIGLDEIGFTEHKDFDPADPVVDYFNYDLYLEEVEAARKTFQGRLTIRAGVEVDYQPDFEEEIAAYLEARSFDYVLGSVHYINRQMLMTPEYLKGRTKVKSYSDYFAAVRQSVESGLIDVVGHLEYANRRGVGAWGAYEWEPYRQQVGELFDAMIRRGVALEINTAGLRQGVGHPYPCEAHIALYADRGGELLTIGSDAHRPEDLASDYTVAVELARKHGLTKISVWGDRKPLLRSLID